MVTGAIVGLREIVVAVPLVVVVGITAVVFECDLVVSVTMVVFVDGDVVTFVVLAVEAVVLGASVAFVEDSVVTGVVAVDIIFAVVRFVVIGAVVSPEVDVTFEVGVCAVVVPVV